LVDTVEDLSYELFEVYPVLDPIVKTTAGEK